VTILRRQWYENERLPFPLAQIYLSLVEPPARGKFFNSILSRRSFWVAFFIVFFIHVWNGLWKYYPNSIPKVPLSYNLYTLFSEPPWIYVDYRIKECSVFFSVIGVAYFLSSSVSFSLWFCFIAYQCYRIGLGAFTGDQNPWGQRDAHTGGLIAYAIVVAWIGRRHWKLVIAQAFRGVRAGEAQGRYLSYPRAVWGLVGCAGIAIGFLVVAGATMLAASVTVLILLLLFVLVARFVAEAGLVHAQITASLLRPWTLIAWSTGEKLIPVDSFYLCSIVQATHFDYRETLGVYATHAVKVADEEMEDDRGARRRLIGLMFLALVIGYCVAFASQLWTEYSYASSKSMAGTTPINSYATETFPKLNLLDPTVEYAKGTIYPKANPYRHMTIGFFITAVLWIGRLRYPWWPIHPIGYLSLGTYPAGQMWLSIFVGWLVKMVVLRLGGPRMYAATRPFFMGVIVGEAGVAGMWLVTSLVLASLGIPYRGINVMPG